MVLFNLIDKKNNFIKIEIIFPIFQNSKYERELIDIKYSKEALDIINNFYN